MPPAATKPPAPRKRNRKRKRRAASSSSSSSSSDSSDSSGDDVPAKKIAPKAQIPQESSSSLSSSSESSDSSSSDEEEVTTNAVPRGRQEEKDIAPKPARRLSPSPSPRPGELPSFLPSKDTTGGSKLQEQELKNKFRQFWMASVADGFRDDLETIRKEPNLGTSRLALLIDSLAAGADVFTSSTNNSGINEMEVVLN
ncbi:hypothetical protein NLJ89_g4079 [Agrocybe chaxingu]|uniref:Ribosome assembly protein 3 n=1 Tax=Agrocybe chaxingu TaxID=84603 RepID=A0A9W8K407_9AGAR|nr:hypothetical protein NLJ89_g4079 [Agrocybe chaxingu]